MRERLNEILAHHTGQPLEAHPGRYRARLHHGGRSRRKEYGIIDDVIRKRSVRPAVATAAMARRRVHAAR